MAVRPSHKPGRTMPRFPKLLPSQTGFDVARTMPDGFDRHCRIFCDGAIEAAARFEAADRQTIDAESGPFSEAFNLQPPCRHDAREFGNAIPERTSGFDRPARHPPCRPRAVPARRSARAQCLSPRHPDCFGPALRQGRQGRPRRGELPDFFPYDASPRFRARRPERFARPGAA
ncbi:isocitrate dehydrogenase kinase/phosphatase [Burkholderia plantarii]|uniref:Isocitrate dehydrogenase kinase/phosphatase n=2 Tax=Burkholderia plantarii TaxID=41899 RepID=A0A0B6RRF6_BURPL|nr:isocitrate dehydrogenase kinase/phosphatase [Burkholderia plantarii]